MSTVSVSGKKKNHLFSVIRNQEKLPKYPGIYFIVECTSNPYGLSMDYIKGMGTCSNFEEHFKNHPLIKDKEEHKNSYIYILPEINAKSCQEALEDIEEVYKGKIVEQRNNLVKNMSISVDNLEKFLKKKK